MSSPQGWHPVSSFICFARLPFAASHGYTIFMGFTGLSRVRCLPDRLRPADGRRVPLIRAGYLYLGSYRTSSAWSSPPVSTGRDRWTDGRPYCSSLWDPSADRDLFFVGRAAIRAEQLRYPGECGRAMEGRRGRRRILQAGFGRPARLSLRPLTPSWRIPKSSSARRPDGRSPPLGGGRKVRAPRRYGAG
jgi:hypothetical protein